MEVFFFFIVILDQLGVKAQNVRKERLPIGVSRGEFVELEYIAVIVLRAQEISDDLAVGPWFQGAPV